MELSHLVRNGGTLCGIAKGWGSGNVDLKFGIKSGTTTCVKCLRVIALEGLESRAASAVDQGLRKAAEDVWDAWKNGKWVGEQMIALEAALTRQAQDGQVIGDEQLRSAAKEMVNYARSRNVLLPREREIIDGLEAALAPRREPSQPVNYVSAPHDAKTMRCQSCGSDQWPQCPSCGALLIEKPESTQKPPLRVDNTDAYEKRLDAKRSNANHPMSGTMQDEVRITDRPSTDDVVGRMCKAYSAAKCPEDQDACNAGMTAALAVARAGWHSWESVEKAIRDVMLFGQYGIHEKREFIKRLCTRLTQDAKAEPAERVTDPAVEAVESLFGHAFDSHGERCCDVPLTPEQVVAAVRKADAQGGKGQ